jgi:type IV pilus assembly protein PilO
VTLNDVQLEASKDGNLSMDVTARTFRYLDDDEVAAQRKASSKKAAPAKK